jgi:hypothetical protein
MHNDVARRIMLSTFGDFIDRANIPEALTMVKALIHRFRTPERSSCKQIFWIFE